MIVDSSIEVVGPDLSRLSYSGGQETTNYANVMYNSLFNQPGLIQAFEYDAVQKGSFHFVVRNFIILKVSLIERGSDDAFGYF